MSRRSSAPQRKPGAPKSSYRLYLERAQAAGRKPLDFEDYLVVARRWRTEYEPARDRGDLPLMRELEDLLCESRGAQGSQPAAPQKRGRKWRRRR